VVQLKCFLTPMSDVEQTYSEIETLFGDQLAPPTSVVEWISTSPIEIEMIVHAPPSSTSDRITHEWLPWLTVSPVYCRYTRIPGDTQVYISGCFGGEGSDDKAQAAAVFQQLQDRLAAAGSDLKHMAKATYYVSNDGASTAMNDVRPMLYDPQHPPAASKAMVHGIGLSGRSFNLDMIAVPAK
jgi:enamine deaminase RidA (YjgF/YER057c/UK114 family)